MSRLVRTIQTKRLSHSRIKVTERSRTMMILTALGPNLVLRFVTFLLLGSPGVLGGLAVPAFIVLAHVLFLASLLIVEGEPGTVRGAGEARRCR